MHTLLLFLHLKLDIFRILKHQYKIHFELCTQNKRLITLNFMVFFHSTKHKKKKIVEKRKPFRLGSGNGYRINSYSIVFIIVFMCMH